FELWLASGWSSICSTRVLVSRGLTAHCVRAAGLRRRSARLGHDRRVRGGARWPLHAPGSGLSLGIDEPAVLPELRGTATSLTRAPGAAHPAHERSQRLGHGLPL